MPWGTAKKKKRKGHLITAALGSLQHEVRPMVLQTEIGPLIENSGDLVSEEASHTHVPAPLNNRQEADGGMKTPSLSWSPDDP